jgi:hypothetical protein
MSVESREIEGYFELTYLNLGSSIVFIIGMG